ncbi:radical SAM protein [Xanthobacter wiegelii]|uniref:radical SAM protein n=1 Tax=Xanthobacter wiegelii TaxID=3119913 RepID=UPI00372680D5
MNMEPIFHTCTSASAGDHVSLILKITGSTCNLDCAYCFEKRRDYPIHRTIDVDMVAKAISHLSAYRLSIELHGGEPLLMGVSRISQMLDVISSVRPDAPIRLQTNATLLNDEWCSLFQRFTQLSIGVSFDGFGKSNIWRYFNSSQPSDDDALSGIGILIRNQLSFGLICVVNKSNQYNFCEYLDWASTIPGLKVVRFLPCFDQDVALSPTVPRNALTQSYYESSNPESRWAINFDDYVIFTKSAYSYWKQKRYFRIFGLDPAGEFLKKLTHGKCSTCHMETTKCNHTITLYPDQTFSSCDELENSSRIPMPAGDDGTNPFSYVLNGLSKAFSSDLLRACAACDVRQICNGGCPAIRNRYAGSDPLGYCKMQKELISFFAAP